MPIKEQNINIYHQFLQLKFDKCKINDKVKR